MLPVTLQTVLLPACLPACVQIEGMVDSIKTATAAPVNPVESKIQKANEGFLQGEGGKQQLLLRCVHGLLLSMSEFNRVSGQSCSDPCRP
jgi:hypothetical protein